MKSKTIETLRAQAKRLGLAGYSKLPKAALLKLIAAGKPITRAKPAARLRKAAARTTTAPKKSRRTPTVTAQTASVGPAPILSSPGREQQVEFAKYAFTPPGMDSHEPAYGADLHEDIERLPALHEPLLCLLPQKPGVLHGYWVLPPASPAAVQSMRLRLAHFAGDRLAILGEHPVPAERGHWYFQVAEDVDPGTVYLQLGRYQPDGEFVSILQRSVARIPNLYASTQTDRRWWVSDAQFRAMYWRTGGRERGARLGWGGSASSPLHWRGDSSHQR